jgi:hypothetical protein
MFVNYPTITKLKIVFGDKKVAENFVKDIKMLEVDYGRVSFGDVKDLIGLDDVFADNRIGWLNVNNVKVKKGWFQQRYYVTMPVAVMLG